MGRITAFSSLTLALLAAVPAFADSVGLPDIPEPVVASAAGSEKSPAPHPVAIESVTVTAPAAASSGTAKDKAAFTEVPATTVKPSEPAKHPNFYRPPAGQTTTQTHTAYRVNHVVVELPAGVRIVTDKDWYTDKIIAVYPANPYTNWRGVKPDALVFTQEKDVLRITAAGTKYVPKEIHLYVRPSVDVQVR